jgi:hypothetical protein
MAVAIPIISAFSAVSAAGTLAAAMGTLGGFLSIAGATLAIGGMLTGQKDLVKIGSLMGLGGSLASAATGAAAGAGEAAAASTEVADSLRAVENASRASPLMEQAAEQTAMRTATQAPGLGAEAAGFDISEAAHGPMSLAERGAQRIGQPAAQSQPGLSIDPAGISSSARVADPVVAGGQAIKNQTELNGVLQDMGSKLRTAFGGLGDHIRSNKELYQLGGGILNSMYGPEAEALDWQNGLLARRRRNLNSQVRLGPVGGG